MSAHIDELVARMPILLPLAPQLEKAVSCMRDTYLSGGKIMTCGNGGSAADSEHIVGELMKGFLLKRPLLQTEKDALEAGGCPSGLVARLQRAVPAISLVSGVSLPTAFANDVDSQAIFAQQVFGLGRREDTLIAISTSGNSVNVLYAAHVARAMGIRVIGLTGNRPNRIEKLADIAIKAPAVSTPEIQEIHLAVYHALCAELEARLFENAHAYRQPGAR